MTKKLASFISRKNAGHVQVLLGTKERDYMKFIAAGADKKFVDLLNEACQMMFERWEKEHKKKLDQVFELSRSAENKSP